MNFGVHDLRQLIFESKDCTERQFEQATESCATHRAYSADPTGFHNRNFHGAAIAATAFRECVVKNCCQMERCTKSTFVRDLNSDACSRQQNELPVSAFALVVILGTAVTLWNLHSAALHVQSVRAPSNLRLDAPFFAPGMYDRLSKKVVNSAAFLKPGHQGPLLENSNERNNADEPLGGQAHLGHDYFLGSPPGTKNVTRWSLDARLRSYVQGSVGYHEGSLVAGKSGYYYVYSQVSFVKALQDWQANQSTVTHELIRLSSASNEAHTLLRAQKTHSWDKQLRCSLDASYLGATFFMHKGDRIFVTVSDRNFMWQSPRRTYFGMRSI